MRPGWSHALRVSRSVMPHRRLLALDERLEHATARPVIVPDAIVCDHDKVFISNNFRALCRYLDMSLQPTCKASPFEKGGIEKAPGSVAALFAHAEREVRDAAGVVRLWITSSCCPLWQAINSYGIRISHRTYDGRGLTPVAPIERDRADHRSVGINHK
ncbi:transposase family protein [Streptomyces paludis]|uniref:transposase family protein n=1 Tax=Streptomyces paludis TaxID=2282738 RepID=UPI001E5F7234|nr:transposase family protein [Streptomyces paludis]